MAESRDHDIGAVLLDLGGVLIHVHFHRTLTHWARAAGMSDDAFRGCIQPDEAYARHERGECSFPEYATNVGERLGIHLDHATMLTGWNLALGDVMPGAMDLVTALHTRYPVYLFSNSNAAHHACWSRDQAQLLSRLRQVFVSHDLGLRKPEPEAFTRVVSHMGIDAGSVAFFDDLEENVEGARRAGLRAFVVNGPAAVARNLGIPLLNS